jgi:hypothetical protein
MTVKIDGTNGIDTAQLRAPDGDPVAMTIGNDGKAAFPQGVTPVSGEILQEFLYTQVLTNVANVNATKVSNDIVFTPKSNNSKLIISALLPAAQIAAAGAGTNNTGIADVREGGSVVGSSSSIGVVSGAGTNIQTQAPCHSAAIIDNAALTARTFAVFARCLNAAGQFTTGPLMFSVREVQN